MSRHSEEYVAHIKSKKWADFKKNAIVAAGRKCQHCSAMNKLLQVHHIHYGTLGNESLGDVMVLCIDCHKLADENRSAHQRVISKERKEFNRYHSAVDRFARKKYGDDWGLTVSSLDVAYDQFDRWVEEKEQARF